MANYTDEELAALSPTEREALTATDETEDETLLDIVGDDDGDDENDGDDDADDGEADGDDAGTDDKGAEDDKGADDIATPDANTDASLDDFDPDSVPAVLFVPKLSGEISEHYELEIEALDAKLDEGEISLIEHRKEVRKLEAKSQNEEIAGQLWKAEQVAFLKDNKQYVATTNPENFAKINKEVMRVANDPANSGLTGIQMLYLAKHNLDESAAFAEFKALRKSGKVPEGKKAVPGKPAAARPNLQTLRDTPSADLTDVGQDKFAHLDKLSGMALEKAISSLSPADYNAYVTGA